MEIDFEKGGGLVPAIVQDDRTQVVLMLGYMNAEALAKTQEEGKVTFFSRSKGRLWTKGETSGNYLELRSIKVDCDQDTLLVRAVPRGPVCHTGSKTCFGETGSQGFIHQLQAIVQERKGAEPESSYTARLFAKGKNKIAQKVGEEAVELVIEAMDDNDKLFKEEAADLLYHMMVLLADRGMSLQDIEEVLADRHRP